MIVFVQPFGLSSAGGGPRIMRALLQDAPHPFLSVSANTEKPSPTSVGEEVHIPMRPSFGHVDYTRLSKILSCTAPLFASQFMRRLEHVCVQRRATAVHAIPQGLEFWYTYLVAKKLDIPYCLNVHDDLSYNLEGHIELSFALKKLGEVWANAEHRIVISNAMGQEYNRRYGQRNYSVVTDGLTHLPSLPRPRHPNRLRLYFTGSMHLSYRPNVESLLLALMLLKQQKPELAISIISRGSAIDPQPGIPVDNRPWGSEAEVAQDLDDVDLLYLPLPFGERYEAFTRLSLSTKMVTYLGSGLPILYHGPADAAAGRLLLEHQAAISMGILEPDVIAQSLAAIADTGSIVENALHLGQQQFMLEDQRRLFWQMMEFQTVESKYVTGLSQGIINST